MSYRWVVVYTPVHFVSYIWPCEPSDKSQSGFSIIFGCVLGIAIRPLCDAKMYKMPHLCYGKSHIFSYPNVTYWTVGWAFWTINMPTIHCFGSVTTFRMTHPTGHTSQQRRVSVYLAGQFIFLFTLYLEL